jgi:hypothetical protein
MLFKQTQLAMKKILLILVGLFLIQSSFVNVISAQENQSGAKLVFEKEREELGNMFVDELKHTELKIKFKNEGDEPLVLSQVRGCCGTRIVDWPRTPLLPGEEGEIQISFRLASRAHKVSRTVTVLSNDRSGASIYRLVGEVMDRADFDPSKSDVMAPTSSKDN